MKDGKWTAEVTNWFLLSRRNRGRQKIRWGDEFAKMLDNKQYHRITHDRLEWVRLREANFTLRLWTVFIKLVLQGV
jgi:hypothetical protein